MPKRVTIDDVARLAEVHKATVSRALNERTRDQVNRDTVERVRLAAQRLGYAPDLMARSLRTRTSMSIGVVIPDLTNPFFPPIVRGIEGYLAPRGYSALLANTDSNELVERAVMAALLDRRVDGFIIASGHIGDAALADVHRAGIPAVLVNRAADGVPYPLITGADAAGVADAVAHLAELGHRGLLHIAGPADISTSSTRSDAFVEACARLGIGSDVVVASALSIEAGFTAMEQWLDRGSVPTGVLASNDLIALGVLRALRSRGLRCPDDVSLVGFNDMPFAEEFSPSLTTVHVPMHDFGTTAARLLLTAISTGEQHAETVQLPVWLVKRGSTAAPRPAA
jgi:LacI family transcriptional regulator